MNKAALQYDVAQTAHDLCMRVRQGLEKDTSNKDLLALSEAAKAAAQLINSLD